MWLLIQFLAVRKLSYYSLACLQVYLCYLLLCGGNSVCVWLNTKEGILHQRQKVCNVGRGKGGRNKSLDEERAPRAGWRMHWKIHSRFLFAYVMCALIRNLELSFLVVNSQKRAGTGFWANEIYRRRTYSWPFLTHFNIDNLRRRSF